MVRNIPRDLSIKPKRGYICGLMSYKFLATLLEAPLESVKYRFRKYLVETGKNSQTLTPGELRQFIERIYEDRKRRGGNLKDIEKYIWTK